MDTNETNEPVGSDGATSSPDTSTDVAQTDETSTEAISDGKVEAESGEASKLLAGKYKSPEELEKAYTELQSKLGEVGQKAELANLLEKTTGMNAQQIKDYLAQQEYAQYQQQVQADPGLAAFQEVQTLKSQLALQNEEKELDKFLNSEEGKPYQDFRDKIFNLGLNVHKDKPYDEIAREYFGQAIAKGQQDAYKKIDKKQMTQASSVSRGAPKQKPTLDDLKKMSSAELEAILPHREDQ